MVVYAAVLQGIITGELTKCLCATLPTGLIATSKWKKQHLTEEIPQTTDAHQQEPVEITIF